MTPNQARANPSSPRQTFTSNCNDPGKILTLFSEEGRKNDIVDTLCLSTDAYDGRLDGGFEGQTKKK
jgi:hypothetical protein